MYDRDLKAWYRDLFLHSPAKKRSRKRPVSDARPLVSRTWGGKTGRSQVRDRAANEARPVGIESHRSIGHDPATAPR
jgi:hypothetical protein